MVLLVEIARPNRNEADQHVSRGNHRVEYEQQEEALVLEADAVVREDAVVTHLEDAALAHAAVVRPSRLELVAFGALAVPEATQVAHSLGAVLH